MKNRIHQEVKKSIKQAIEDNCLQDIAGSKLSEYDFDLASIVVDFVSDDSCDIEYDRLMMIAKGIASDEFNRIISRLIAANNMINEVLS